MRRGGSRGRGRGRSRRGRGGLQAVQNDNVQNRVEQCSGRAAKQYRVKKGRPQFKRTAVKGRPKPKWEDVYFKKTTTITNKFKQALFLNKVCEPPPFADGAEGALVALRKRFLAFEKDQIRQFHDGLLAAATATTSASAATASTSAATDAATDADAREYEIFGDREIGGGRTLLKWMEIYGVDTSKDTRNQGGFNIGGRMNILATSYIKLVPAARAYIDKHGDAFRFAIGYCYRQRDGNGTQDVERCYAEEFTVSHPGQVAAKMEAAALRMADRFQKHILGSSSGLAMQDVKILSVFFTKVPAPTSGRYTPTPKAIGGSVINVNNKEGDDCVLYALASHTLYGRQGKPFQKSPYRMTQYHRNAESNELGVEQLHTLLADAGVTFPINLFDDDTVDEIERLLGFPVVVHDWDLEEERATLRRLAKIHPTSRRDSCFLLLLPPGEDEDAGAVSHCVYVTKPHQVLAFVNNDSKEKSRHQAICPCCLERARTAGMKGEMKERAIQKFLDDHKCSGNYEPSISSAGYTPKLLSTTATEHAKSVPKLVWISFAETRIKKGNTSVVAGFHLECHLLGRVKARLPYDKKLRDVVNEMKMCCDTVVSTVQSTDVSTASMTTVSTDCMSEFTMRLADLQELYTRLCHLHDNMDQNSYWLVPENEKKKAEATHCHLCDKEFVDEDDKALDHCHVINAIYGWSHRACNTARQVGFLPLICMGDYGPFVRELLSVLPADMDVRPFKAADQSMEAGIIGVSIGAAGKNNQNGLAILSLKRMGYCPVKLREEAIKALEEKKKRDPKNTESVAEDPLGSDKPTHVMMTTYLERQSARGVAVLEAHRIALYNLCGLDPLCSWTLPSYAYAAKMRCCKAEIMPPPSDILEDILKCFAGGLCGAVMRRYDASVTPDYVAVDMDLRASYVALLRQLVPVKQWKRFKAEELSIDMELEPEGYCRFFCVDVHALIRWHHFLSDMAGFPERMTVPAHWKPAAHNAFCPDKECTVEHLHPRKQYWVTGPELAYQIKRGWVLDKIHGCIQAKGEAVFAPWAELIKKGREEATDEAQLKAIKLCGNASIGQHGMRSVNHCMTNLLHTEQAFFVATKKRGVSFSPLADADKEDTPHMYQTEPVSATRATNSAGTKTHPDFATYQNEHLSHIIFHACSDVTALSKQTDGNAEGIAAAIEERVKCARAARRAMTPKEEDVDKMIEAACQKAIPIIGRKRATEKVKARQLTYCNIKFLDHLVNEIANKSLSSKKTDVEFTVVQKLGVHQLRVDLTKHAEAGKEEEVLAQLQALSDDGILTYKPYRFAGKALSHTPKPCKSPTRSYPIFAWIVSLGRVALMKMADDVTSRGGRLCSYDTDGLLAIMPRSVCTASDGSGDHVRVGKDIGDIKHENKDKDIAWINVLGNKSRQVGYADGTTKIVAAGHVDTSTMTPEAFLGAMQRKDVDLSSKYMSRTGKDGGKIMSRSMNLRCAGRCLITDEDSGMPICLTFGHCKTPMRGFEQEDDEQPSAKRAKQM